MAIETKTVFETTDGTVFDTLQEAEAYERELVLRPRVVQLCDRLVAMYESDEHARCAVLNATGLANMLLNREACELVSLLAQAHRLVKPSAEARLEKPTLADALQAKLVEGKEG